jgi:hypothetical protein
MQCVMWALLDVCPQTSFFKSQVLQNFVWNAWEKHKTDKTEKIVLGGSKMGKKLRHKNKTNSCIWKHVNLLHYRGKIRTYFGHLLRISSGSCFSKDVLQRTSKSLYKYKLLRFQYHIKNIYILKYKILIKFFKRLITSIHLDWSHFA